MAVIRLIFEELQSICFSIDSDILSLFSDLCSTSHFTFYSGSSQFVLSCEESSTNCSMKWKLLGSFIFFFFHFVITFKHTPSLKAISSLISTAAFSWVNINGKVPFDCLVGVKM